MKVCTILCLLCTCVYSTTVKCSFLHVDELHQFASTFEFVGNDPARKVDRTGKGWEDAFAVDMGHYSVEIDFSEVRNKRSIYRMNENGEVESNDLFQYDARAMSRNGISGATFRVSSVAESSSELANAERFFTTNHIANCSSFALDTYSRGFLITTHSTPLPILDHPYIYESFHFQPVRLSEAGSAIAMNNDILTEFANDRNEFASYFHTRRIVSDHIELMHSSYTDKSYLASRPNQSNVRYMQERNGFVKLYRPRVEQNNLMSFVPDVEVGSRSSFLSKTFKPLKFWK